MYRSLFPRDLFAELDRLQSEIGSLFDASPAIRGLGRGGFPALNVGSTPTSVEIYAFAPGIDPKALEINLERGVLTIDGERRTLQGNAGGNAAGTGSSHGSSGNGSSNGNGNGASNGNGESGNGGAGKTTSHLSERFSGRFRRVISLPDDVDPASCDANYRDGVLHVSVKRRESAQPRRIEVQ